ncbi:MAG: C10 family peptidase [Prevotellaceae bacterium]|jgi:hypothetical protein|nr:C10 family peptidase [Prevotellaceae bacterium]
MKNLDCFKICFLFAFLISTVACTKEDNPAIDGGTDEKKEVRFTEAEQKVLYQMRNGDNRIGIEEAMQIAGDVIDFLDEESPATKSGNSRRIATVTHLHTGKKAKIATKSSSDDNSSVEMPDTLAYLFNFADSAGFTIIAADTRIETPILCYTGSGTLGDSIDNPGLAVFLSGAEDYIERSIIEAEHLRDSLMTDILAKIDETGVKDTVYVDADENEAKTKASTTTEIDRRVSYSYGAWTVDSKVGPLLSVEWGQGIPFNSLISKNNCTYNYLYGNKAPVGCVAVSTAYILTYWFNKMLIDFKIDGYSIDSRLLCNYTCAPNRSGRYSGLATLDINANTSEAYQARSQVARLMERIGKWTGMDYGCGGSSTTTSNGVEFLREVGFTYGVPGYFNEKWELGFDYNFNTVFNSLNRERPVMIRGDSFKTNHSFLFISWSTYSGGHSWVIDGYLRRKRLVTVTVTTTTTTTEETVYDPQVPLRIQKKMPYDKKLLCITTTTTSTYTEYSKYYLHNNWGNYGGNGHFVEGCFNRNSKDNLSSNTKSGEKGNYQYRNEIFPEIYYKFP